MSIDVRNPGGTPGGMHHFLVGLVMTVLGGYLLLQHVQVHGGYWSFGFMGFGYGTSFGMTLIPLLFGIGILFFNGKSAIGRLLTGLGLLLILGGIIMNLNIHFQQTSLYNLLVMLVLIVGGVGLIARGVLPMGGAAAPATAEAKND